MYLKLKKNEIMKKNFTILFAIMLLSGLFIQTYAQDADTSKVELNPVETFEPGDCPRPFSYEGMSFYSPWGYKKEDNASRYYPLLVSGKWGEGKTKYAPVAQDYPAFVIGYQKSTESDGQALAQWIKCAINSGYRIDSRRIYLTGFSAGGSGSYPLAKGMYIENLYFAAIIRVSGQSQADIGNAIAQETAVWYHIGLDDEVERVEVAREALDLMRNYECNSEAVETQSLDSITGYDRTTVTLTRSGSPMYKYSEYTGMGHTPEPCYTDSSLFYWVFNNSLGLEHWLQAGDNTGIASFNSTDVNIYPNPSQGMLNIKNPSSGEFSYEIYSVTGEMVAKRNEISSSISTINMDNFAKGMYFINVKSSGIFETHKLILK